MFMTWRCDRKDHGLCKHCGEYLCKDGHTSVTYTWTDDCARCTASRICTQSGKAVETEVTSTTKTVTQKKSCTDDELSTFSADFTHPNFTGRQKDAKTADKTEHNYEQKYDDTNHWLECSACNDKKDITAHIYDKEVAEDKYLASAANCEHAAKYYKSCACGKVGTETFTSGGLLDHNYEWKRNASQHWQECTMCHAERRRGDHQYDAASVINDECMDCGYKIGSSTGDQNGEHDFEWKYNSQQHWEECKTCNAEQNRGNHQYDTASVINDVCTVCGYRIGTPTSDQNDHPHTYDREVASINFLVSVADCESPAVYYKSCSCGVKGTETFTFGEPLGHSYGEWQMKAAATCTAKGVEFRKCSVCAEEDTRDTDMLPHDYADATCTAPKTCKNCPATTGEPLGHSYGEWSNDKTHHWHKCSRCDYIGYNAAHDYDSNTDKTCNTCGYTRTISLGGGTVTSVYYTINATANEGGAISPSGVKSLRRGGSQTYTITPDSGYKILDVKVDGKSVGAVDSYSFRNVGENHTVGVTFEKIKDHQSGGTLPFADVVTDYLFYDDVAYVYDRDLMKGISDTEFAPELITARAMIVTVLYRLEGEPDVSGSHSFGDVKNDAWYSKAIAWAEQVGIVKGYSKDRFGVEDPITREQLATILYRYMQYKGMSAVTLSENLSGFSDHEQVSDYAVQAMNWAVASGIICGADNRLMPTEAATRAQVAAVLHRFCENVLK